MSFWKLEESRLVQVRSNVSVANAESVIVNSDAVPSGKVWVVTGFGYMPDAAETQVITIEKYSTSSGIYCAVLNPVSLALNPAHATFIEQGMEYFLFPNEQIVVRRGGHTVGSIMQAWMQIIEIDQPLYTYEEPQEVKRQKIALSSIRRVMGGGGRPGSMVGSAGRGGSGGGSRGGAEPV